MSKMGPCGIVKKSNRSIDWFSNFETERGKSVRAAKSAYVVDPTGSTPNP